MVEPVRISTPSPIIPSIKFPLKEPLNEPLKEPDVGIGP